MTVLVSQGREICVIACLFGDHRNLIGFSLHLYSTAVSFSHLTAFLIRPTQPFIANFRDFTTHSVILQSSEKFQVPFDQWGIYLHVKPCDFAYAIKESTSQQLD